MFHIEKIVFEFSVVIVATSSTEIFFIAAIFSVTSFRNDGIFLLPLCGAGARYGESVSRTRCFNSISEIVLSNPEFLELTKFIRSVKK